MRKGVGQEEAGVNFFPSTIRADASPLNEEVIQINAIEICSGK